MDRGPRDFLMHRGTSGQKGSGGSRRGDDAEGWGWRSGTGVVEGSGARGSLVGRAGISLSRLRSK